MKILDIYRLNEMIQLNLDIDDLLDMGLTDDEVLGYLELFADNIIDSIKVTGEYYEN